MNTDEDMPVRIADGLHGEDALADLHAKYHCEDGNMLRGDCGWECSFWEIATYVGPAFEARLVAQREAIASAIEASPSVPNTGYRRGLGVAALIARGQDDA